MDDVKEKIKSSKDKKSLNHIQKMFSYCLQCRKNAESKSPKVVRTKNGRITLLSKFSVCNSKKLKFRKEQEARRLISNLMGVPILSDLSILNTKRKIQKYEMNAIVNKLLLAGDKFVRNAFKTARIYI